MAFGLVVLVSGTGTLLQALIDEAAADRADGADGADGADEALQIRAVVSDRPGVLALERAAAADIPTVVHPFARGADRVRWDAELTELVAGFAPDLVVSAGFMKLLGPAFLSRFAGRVINTHPALLPSFPGMHGPRDALAHGVKVTGATVFAVDAGVDTGRILAQAAVDVRDGDTVESLHARIKPVEAELLLRTVRQLAGSPGPVDDLTTSGTTERADR